MVKMPCEIYSRIVGYYRPIRKWNVGKLEEWKDRKVYTLEEEPEESEETGGTDEALS